MHNLALVWQGLRFGILLQLAVGPVCLMVLNTSVSFGFLPTLSLIAAVALVDAFYVTLSSLGATVMLSKPSVNRNAQWIGGLVLVVFGADMALGSFGFSVLPGIRLFSNSTNADLFVQGLVLTLSNPLTILFWGSVLTGKVSEMSWSRKQLCWFTAGCVLATVLFLTSVAALASTLRGNIPDAILTALNIAVGVTLICFGVRMIVRKK